jgi:hypothetical protein
MHFLKPVDVDDAFVDEEWKKVSSVGGYYSIGDGVSKDVFRRMFFQSDFVLQSPSLTIRIVAEKDCLEVHPIVFGGSVFRHAVCALEDIVELRDKHFANKPICCIIPNEMHGARRLAVAAGMTEAGKCSRSLSGVEIPCTIFTWR